MMDFGFNIQTDRKGTVILTGHMDVPKARYPQVKAALEWHIKKTREEPGCLMFKVEPCRDVQYRFLVSEKFVDQEAFDAHQARTKESAWAEVTRLIPREYEVRVVG